MQNTLSRKVKQHHERAGDFLQSNSTAKKFRRWWNSIERMFLSFVKWKKKRKEALVKTLFLQYFSFFKKCILIKILVI